MCRRVWPEHSHCEWPTATATVQLKQFTSSARDGKAASGRRGGEGKRLDVFGGWVGSVRRRKDRCSCRVGETAEQCSIVNNDDDDSLVKPSRAHRAGYRQENELPNLSFA